MRDSVTTGALRVYGFFPDDERFVFLLGNVKKKDKDQDALKNARKRMKRLLNGEGRTDGFVFAERITDSTPEGTPRESGDGGGESL